MKIIWTCTAGRRISYFIQMMDSFLDTCQDKDLISRFICIDDRSEKRDLEILKKRYPIIEFYNNLKYGQLNSLKLLLDLDAEYLFHTEDDWLFLADESYITKCLKIMDLDNRIKQVTLRHWETMYIKQNEFEYGMHVYSPFDTFRWNVVQYNDCDYPGLSFNPSLIDYKVFKKCIVAGKQDTPECRGWDKQVAKAFWDFGYKRANLYGNYIKHIGKETYYTRNK
ncbi:MAG: hypothetical protein ACFFDN_05005 [Candidatus Hodarchaeota archaeon]